jgi:hypothetical protein
MHGKIAGSRIETDKSGHVRVREASRVLARDKWLTVESASRRQDPARRTHQESDPAEVPLAGAAYPVSPNRERATPRSPRPE